MRKPTSEKESWNVKINKSRQQAGAKAIKQRKRNERKEMNKLLYAAKQTKREMKKFGISDQIQKGFKIAKRWKNDNDTVTKKEK